MHRPQVRRWVTMSRVCLSRPIFKGSTAAAAHAKGKEATPVCGQGPRAQQQLVQRVPPVGVVHNLATAIHCNRQPCLLPRRHLRPQQQSSFF